jgi:hypothetical protein
VDVNHEMNLNEEGFYGENYEKPKLLLSEMANLVMSCGLYVMGLN